MGRFRGSSAPCILGVLLLSSLPTPANAQLKSFAAIGILALDPPLPGTEKAYKSFLSANQEVQVLEAPTNPELKFYRAEQFARCTLRTDLPKPRPLGLVCRDYAGQYVGTLRATTTSEFQKTLRSIRSDQVGPRARPLTQYEFIYVDSRRNEGPLNYARYMEELLRPAGAWRVVPSPDMVPPSATDRVLRCEVDRASPTPWRDPRLIHGGMTLRLSDSTDQVVRRDFFWYPSSNAKKDLQKAVRELLDAWRADEEIYKPLPPDGPRPPKVPSP